MPRACRTPVAGVLRMAQQALDCPRGPSLTLFYQFSPQLYKLLMTSGPGPHCPQRASQTLLHTRQPPSGLFSNVTSQASSLSPQHKVATPPGTPQIPSLPYFSLKSYHPLPRSYFIDRLGLTLPQGPPCRRFS